MKIAKKALKKDKISELGFKLNIVKAKPISNSILHRKVCDQLWFLDILVVGIHAMEPLDNGSYWSIGSIDKMASLSIGIWNWIGVYVRPCLSSKVPKQGCPCIGLEIGFGHILRVISFIDIDMMASLSIGLGYIWGLAYLQRCRNRGFHVLDWKLDWVIS